MLKTNWSIKTDEIKLVTLSNILAMSTFLGLVPSRVDLQPHAPIRIQDWYMLAGNTSNAAQTLMNVYLIVMAELQRKTLKNIFQSSSQSLIIVNASFKSNPSHDSKIKLTNQFRTISMAGWRETLKIQPRILFIYLFIYSPFRNVNYTIKGLYWSKHTEWSSSTGDNSNKISVW